MNIGHVSGGTHAGWRKTKAQGERWYCKCPYQNPQGHPRYLVNCTACKERRP